MTELKILSPTDKEFTANGKTYRVGSRLSLNRWRKYLDLQAEFGMGVTLGDLMQTFSIIFQKVNENKLADIAVLSRDAMIGIQSVTQRSPQALRLCALFINHEGEEVSDITDDQIEMKIADWTKEGYDVQSFFHLAVASLEGFKESYEAATALISNSIIKQKMNRSSATNSGSSQTKT